MHHSSIPHVEQLQTDVKTAREAFFNGGFQSNTGTKLTETTLSVAYAETVQWDPQYRHVTRKRRAQDVRKGTGNILLDS